MTLEPLKSSQGEIYHVADLFKLGSREIVTVVRYLTLTLTPRRDGST